MHRRRLFERLPSAQSLTHRTASDRSTPVRKFFPFSASTIRGDRRQPSSGFGIFYVFRNKPARFVRGSIQQYDSRIGRKNKIHLFSMTCVVLIGWHDIC